jgi:2-polyprenyl-3-methyl-5-hydroxy-6-metoxy-1,4-benzoquinol methylase
MNNYAEYLESISSPATWKRKIDYARYNFGPCLTGLGPGSRVLEIGPGRGELVSYLNGLGITDIDVVDNDQSILDLVRGRCRIANALRADTLEDAAPHLGAYDVVFAVQVLEHIPVTASPAFLRILDQHLKKSGQLIFVVPNGGNPLSIIERYWDLQHQTAFTENSLKALPNFCGLGGYEARVEGFRIPPYTPVNWFRIAVQKSLHLALFALLLANGGTYQRIMTPNLTLILKKR